LLRPILYIFAHLILVLALLCICHDLNGQTEKKSSSFIEANFHFGENYYPGGDLEDELVNGYKGLDFRFGKQMYDPGNWSAVFNHVNYGVGYWVSDIGDTDIFSNPMAVFGFINFPIYRAKNIEVLFGPALGLGFNMKPFDPITNPQNDLTGGRFAAYFNPSVSMAFKVSPSLDIKVGGNFIHMSNGGLRQPNTGIDMYGLNVGVRYHLNRVAAFGDVDYTKIYPAKGKKNNIRSSSINLFQAIGGDQNPQDLGDFQTYLVSTTTLEYQYRFNELHGFSAGINLFYDESAPLSIAYPDHETKLFPGIHAGYDFHFWRLAIRQQFGYMITEAGQDIKAGFFMRLGLSADITETLYFQAAVKSVHGFKADWADFGFGVRLWKR